MDAESKRDDWIYALRTDCATCEGDGYLDIVDDFGGVIGPKPCPDCAEPEREGQ